MKTPVTSRSTVSSDFTFRIRTPVTSPRSTPRTSSTTESHRTSILSLSNTRAAITLDARSSSLRWMRVTDEQRRERNRASSAAVSPPPTTATGWFRKKAPSQVAQADTPRPRSACSDSRPRYRALAPVAIMTARASSVPPPDNTSLGESAEKSEVDTSSMRYRAPNRSACCRISPTSAVPSVPSGKPGKFSTSAVVVSWPPGCSPSITSGERSARAA